MNRGIAWMAVASALVVGNSAARADGTATASLTGLHLQLIDLAPGDGVAPSVEFSTPDGGSLLVLQADLDSLRVPGEHAFDPLSMSLGPSHGFASSASIAGDIFAGTLAMQESTFSSSDRIGFATASAYLYYDDAARLPNLPFALSPHTRMVISGFATGSGAVTNGRADVTQGEVFLGLTDSLADAAAGIHTDNDSLAFAAGYERTGHPISDSEQRQLSVSFDNLGDGSSTGLFTIAVQSLAGTFDLASSVPEPGTAGLMLAGLGLLGLARARGRSPSRRVPAARRSAARRLVAPSAQKV